MSDIDKMLNRKDIARRDCPNCQGRGWTGEQGVNEQPCLGPEEGGTGCGGSGYQEKEVPYDFALGRNRTDAELRHIAFGEPEPGMPRPPKDPGDEEFRPPVA